MRWTSNGIVALIILVSVVVLGAGLRFYKLDRIPRGLNCDEAAMGYDAYSLLKTGRDLHGRYMPWLMKSHDEDYLEPMHTYLTVPVVALFALNVFAVRFLPALVGTLTVLTAYLLAKELFDRRTGLLAAFLVAVSPWDLQFSRIAFRGIFLPLFVTLALFFFLRGLKRSSYLVACGAAFGLALYTYSVAKAFVPLTLVALALMYFRELREMLRRSASARRHLMAAAATFIILAAPMYYLAFFGKEQGKFSQISVFNDPEPAYQFLVNFFKHLSPNFLFTEGEADSFLHFGQVLLVLAPFIAFALYVGIKEDKKSCALAVILFLIGIVPAALTNRGIPHPLRSIGSVPFLELLAAFGLVYFYDRLATRRYSLKIPALAVVAGLLLWNCVAYVHAYFVRYPVLSETWFEFGLQDAIAYTEKHRDEYNGFVLTKTIREGYVFPLFFAKLDPSQYHKRGRMGKYITWEQYSRDPLLRKGRNLYIVSLARARFDEDVQAFADKYKDAVRFRAGKCFVIDPSVLPAAEVPVPGGKSP